MFTKRYGLDLQALNWQTCAIRQIKLYARKRCWQTATGTAIATRKRRFLVRCKAIGREWSPLYVVLHQTSDNVSKCDVCSGIYFFPFSDTCASRLTVLHICHTYTYNLLEVPTQWLSRKSLEPVLSILQVERFKQSATMSRTYTYTVYHVYAHTCTICVRAVHTVFHAIFDLFWPPLSVSHFVTHLGTPKVNHTLIYFTLIYFTLAP